MERFVSEGSLWNVAERPDWCQMTFQVNLLTWRREVSPEDINLEDPSEKDGRCGCIFSEDYWIFFRMLKKVEENETHCSEMWANEKRHIWSVPLSDYIHRPIKGIEMVPLEIFAALYPRGLAPPVCWTREENISFLKHLNVSEVFILEYIIE